MAGINGLAQSILFNIPINMRMRIISLVVVSLCICCGYGQNDTNLKKLKDDVVGLRHLRPNASREACINEWAAKGKPKLTLMDDIGYDMKAEYHGKDANRFKLNQIITHVYKRQNKTMVTKGEFFNSTERGIYYSAIEKTLRGKQKASYTLRGHQGIQEFVIVAYNPQCRFSVAVNGKEAHEVAEGVKVVDIGMVEKNDTIRITLSNMMTNNESFVILNHNPQKP